MIPKEIKWRDSRSQSLRLVLVTSSSFLVPYKRFSSSPSSQICFYILYKRKIIVIIKLPSSFKSYVAVFNEWVVKLNTTSNQELTRITRLEDSTIALSFTNLPKSQKKNLKSFFDAKVCTFKQSHANRSVTKVQSCNKMEYKERIGNQVRTFLSIDIASVQSSSACWKL